MNQLNNDLAERQADLHKLAEDSAQDDRLLSPSEVAEKTGLTLNAISKRIGRETLRCVRVGGARFIPESEVARVLGESESFQETDSTVEAASKIGVAQVTPGDLLEEHNLDPEEWEVTDFRLSRWGAEDAPLRQIRANYRRKLLPPPDFIARSDGWKAPKKIGHGQLSNRPKLVVFVGDQQAPYHDEKLHSAFVSWLARNTPDEGVLIGDTADFPGDVSQHPANPEKDATPKECVQAAYDVLRGYVDSSLNTKWTKLLGNHDDRIRKTIIKQVPALYDFAPAATSEDPAPLPVWHPRIFYRLDELDIDLVDPKGPYEHAQHNVSDKLAARHGWLVPKGAGKSALATLDHLGYSIVVGHTHRQAVVHRTIFDIDGQPSTLTAVETGCMCRIDGLGYTVNPDWQQGFATASIWPDGKFKIDLATYVNNTLLWRDQRYS